jgi:hypothetical protein
LALLAGSAVWLAVGLANAQTPDDATRGAARTMGDDGVSAYQAGDYALAHEKLEKAYRLLKAPSLGVWSARALVKLGRLVEASERYREVTRLPILGGDPVVQKQAQAEAQAELDALAPRIPSIVVVLEGAAPQDTTVTLDGVPLAPEILGEQRPANPGHHTLVGRRGSEEVRAETDVAEGEKKTVRLVFSAGAGTPLPVVTSGAGANPPNDAGTDPGATQRLLGWISIGAGGVGLAVGATFGVLAMSKHRELEDSGDCREDQCLDSASADVDTLDSHRTVSTIGFVAGGVLAATGVVLVVTAPSAEDARTSALRFGPGVVSFEGTF